MKSLKEIASDLDELISKESEEIQIKLKQLFGTIIMNKVLKNENTLTIEDIEKYPVDEQIKTKAKLLLTFAKSKPIVRPSKNAIKYLLSLAKSRNVILPFDPYTITMEEFRQWVDKLQSMVVIK